MDKKAGSAASGWLVSAGTVGKGGSKQGVSIRSRPGHESARWQLLPGATTVSSVQARQVWDGVLCALVGDV